MEESSYPRACDLIRLGQLDEANAIVDAEIQRVASQGNSNELWKLRFLTSRILAIKGQVEEAVKYLESLSPPDIRDVESCASLKMRRGSYLGDLGRYEAAHQLLFAAESMARDAGLLEVLADVHLRRGFVFFLQKDYVSSDRMYRAARDLAGQSGDWYLRGTALWGIGKILMIQGHYQEAMPWLEEALGIFDAAESPLDVATVWSELAVCYLGLEDDDKAMTLFRKAEKVNCEAGFVHNYQVVLANIGNVYLHRKEYLTAISYYRWALALAREIKDPVSIKKWTYNINLTYARIRLATDLTHLPSPDRNVGN